ncbi:MAG: thiamine phosphate synthase [bacterium]
MFRFPDRLYPIADADSCADVVGLAEAIVAAGARLLQLRAKSASTRELIDLARAVMVRTDRAGAALIVNDRADVARLVGAAGVHLGQDDLPPAAARAILGPDAVIGFSTHDVAQLEDAVRDGVTDYLAFGPIFPTRSKANPDATQGIQSLAAARAACPRPLVAIGGIGAANLADVLAIGVDAAAVIAAIAGAPDPAAATRALLLATGRTSPPRGATTARRFPAGS